MLPLSSPVPSGLAAEVEEGFRNGPFCFDMT